MTTNETKPARLQTGTVARVSGQQTLVVTISRLVRHPRYQKVLRRVTRLHVHDERAQCRQGDVVEVQPCRPISRTKHWRVVRVVKPASAAAGVEVPS